MEEQLPETAIVAAAPVALAKPTTPRAIIMAQALQEDTEQRAILGQYVEKHMREGTDYGVIPGTNKPTLLKPGAEKLTDLYRCTPEFDIVNRLEDWDKGLFQYEFRCKITSRDTSQVLAVGVGSANSREGRYRWRNSGRKCPQCGKETIIKGKSEYGGGWICFAKKGGCGAKWDDGAKEIEGQEQGRVENDDVFTLVNTILKMAKKRALVDGAIALARCSDLFTQDVEDLVDQVEHERPATAKPAGKPAATSTAKKPTGKGAKNTPPPWVAALWKESQEVYGSEATTRWGAAATEAGLGKVPSSGWTKEDVARVEAALFEPDNSPPGDEVDFETGPEEQERLAAESKANAAKLADTVERAQSKAREPGQEG